MAGNKNSGRRSPRLLMIQRTIELEACKIVRDTLRNPDTDENTRLKCALPFALQSNSARHSKDLVELKNSHELPHSQQVLLTLINNSQTINQYARKTSPTKLAVNMAKQLENSNDTNDNDILSTDYIDKHA